MSIIKEKTEFKLDQVIIYGESLGSGVAVELGTKYNFLSIVLEAPFTSIEDIAKMRYRIFPTKIYPMQYYQEESKFC